MPPLYRAVIFLLKRNADSSLYAKRSSQQGDRGTRRHNYRVLLGALALCLSHHRYLSLHLTLVLCLSFDFFFLPPLSWCEVNQEVGKHTLQSEGLPPTKAQINVRTVQPQSCREPERPPRRLIKCWFTWIQEAPTCRQPYTWKEEAKVLRFLQLIEKKKQNNVSIRKWDRQLWSCRWNPLSVSRQGHSC